MSMHDELSDLMDKYGTHGLFTTDLADDESEAGRLFIVAPEACVLENEGECREAMISALEELVAHLKQPNLFEHVEAVCVDCGTPMSEKEPGELN
ncbi:MAG: hypothetical protein GTO63_05765 [Anaerolineae bacterium]|nr:hypothetical protein [Anaerolineae bacterium]NIN94480.1 hypothetical protein [Anaerolineae bacterium]NIQ77548.1 hypothetical protein [Anaerolineae bacterium]